MFNMQTNTVSITDYRLKSPALAKVIISFTGDVDRQFVHEDLVRQFDGQAAPIKASFKRVEPGVAVGFVRANRSVRVVNDNELKAYKIMGSNIIMDDEDKSLWEVKNGASGKYLARHGQEDLTALVASVRHVRTDIPRLSRITIAKAAASELVSFVDDEGDVDHGFAFANSIDGQKVRIVSFQRRQPLTVDYDSVIGIQPVPVPNHLRAQVLASMTAEEKKQAIAYWTRLYSYSPEYLRDTIKQVNEGTFA